MPRPADASPRSSPPLRPRAELAPYRALLDAVSDGLLVVDEGGVIALANPQAEAVLGYGRGELEGQPFEPRLAERHREAIVAEQRRIASSRQRRRLGTCPPVMGLRKDGSEVALDIGLSSITGPGGSLSVVVVRDVSAQLLAQQRLREANEQARLIIDEAPIGKAIGDLQGRLLRVNRAFCELVGYSADELVSRSFKDITHPDDIEADLAMLDRLRRGEIGRYQRDKRYVRKDGSTVRVSIWLSLARDQAGQPLCFIAQVEDLTERWRASEALRRSEFRCQALVDQAPIGVFIADLDGRYIEVNAYACSMLGYRLDELIGKTIVDLIPPGDVAKLAAAKERLLAPGSSHIDEWVLRHKEGRWVPVRVNAAILPDGRWQAFVTDISVRKQTEEALRKSEQGLRRAQRMAHLGSWDWDVRTGEITRSPELYLLYGHPPPDEHPQAMSFLHQVPEPERQAVRAEIEAAIAAGRAYGIEHRIVRPDGDERIFLQQGLPVREGGELVRFTGTVLDVTELRRAQRAREEALGELQAVLEACPVGITIARQGGESFEANAVARQLFDWGIDPSTGISQLVGRMKSLDGAVVPLSSLPGALALAGQKNTRELLFDARDGRRHPLEIRAAPVFAPDGSITSAVGVVIDLSQQKELERLRSEWNSIIAHDLRQPLNNIGIYAQILARQPIDWPPKAREAIAQIRHMTRRLSRMTFDLLDLSRLDAGRLTIERRPVDLLSLVRECAERASLDASSWPIEVRAEGELPSVEGDPDRLAQVLENLLSNAVKYGFPGTPVEVALGREGAQLKVAVTNQGRGIPPGELDRIFERFARSSANKARGIAGIGLGLPIVKGLVEAHGGQIGVESVPGEKTTFWFTLPAA